MKNIAGSEFNDFVTANGGRRNAMTSDEFTLYFFDIHENAFEEGVDRFAQIFISPLLSKSAMQREREAVDSEYQMALSSDGERSRNFIKKYFNFSAKILLMRCPHYQHHENVG